MATEVIMPQLGESVVEGTVTRWYKDEGEEVAEFESLLEVNTDKVDTEIPSPAGGTVIKILVPEGKTVNAGTILAWIGELDEAIPETEDSPTEEVDLEIDAFPGAQPLDVSKQPARDVALNSSLPEARDDRDLGFISPVVARIASAENIDLSQVRGTGKGGRITKKDILAFLEKRAEMPAPAAVSAWETPVEGDLFKPTELLFGEESKEPARPSETEVVPGSVMPLTPVRHLIAEHMVRSKQVAPHVTTVMEVDLQRVVAHRSANKETFARDGVSLTFSAYFVAASVAALKVYPIANSSWTDEGIQVHRQINIGVAVSLGEEGLIVPVIKNADGLSLLGIARAVNDLADRARSKRLSPDEVHGGTFTITNHGVSGSLFATPIINQPQSAILGVGVIQKRAVVINDAIAIRPMAYLSLTIDHRILDGAIADYVLGVIVKTLQNWG